MRVVIDANVFVSSLIQPAGAPARVVDLQVEGVFELVTSTILLDELRDVLTRPRIMRLIHAGAAAIEAHLAHLGTSATIVQPSTRVTVCRDPADNRVLEAAVAGRAEYVVSGDQDLLALGTFEGIPIVTPGRLLAILAEDARS